MLPRLVAGVRSAWDERRARSQAIAITPFEQAQRSWARSIGSYADLPGEYAVHFEPLHAAGAPFPLVVVAPSYEGFLHRETEKLVCATSDEITILERRGHKLHVHRYPIRGIHRVEVSSVLLDARLKIVGPEADGLPPSSTSVRFNAVTEFLFYPIVTTIRSGGRPSMPAPSGRSNVFDSWGRPSFKFMNYAKRSLLGGEEVQCAILQPEIRMTIVSAFGRTFRRTVSPTHATILTDHELIGIQEVVTSGGRGSYGGIWDYVPLRSIDRLSIAAGDRGLVTLTVHLPGDDRFTLLYDASAGREVEALAGAFSKLRELGEASGTLAGIPPATTLDRIY